ncbi:superkiller complex helicase subunit twister isoform X1 [Tachypleus tridentatus]|uniref:superkiller complex helicase subunit twister isoform X1 n=1 Tax=Tachypleus tridentatus TaxID=6853 RepID=UPI003FD55C0D
MTNILSIEDLLSYDLEIVELGSTGKVDVQPKDEESPSVPKSTLPFGPPPLLLDFKTQLLEFLDCAEKLPIHHVDHVQKFIPRKPNIASLYSLDLEPLQTSLQVDRDPTTGQLLGFKEVKTEEQGATAKNSMSLQRAPGPPSEAVRGSSTNIPFWPGGMDEPSMEVLKAATKQEDIDFDRGLLSVPPGFKNGMTFEKPELPESEKDTSTKEVQVLNLMDIMSVDDDWDLQACVTDTLKKTPEEFQEPKKVSVEAVSVKEEEVWEEIIEMKPLSVTLKIEDVPSVKETLHSSTSEWATMVNTSDTVTDFDKKIPNMARTWEFELDTFQKQAILHLENHESVFVAAHTSAGKTVVAEYAIALSEKHMTKTVYTSPIKALSNQKFRDFRETFKDVGLITGDLQIKPDASCLIMTTEILRSMLYNGSDIIRDVEWVIFDEVHYINDAERGVVWEEVLIMLPDHVELILLSATVPNTMEFADWIGRTKKKKIYVISTLKRPVPLEHYLYTGSGGKTRDEKFLIVDENNKFSTKGYQAAVNAKNERASKFQQTRGPKGPRQNVMPQQEKNTYIALIHHLTKLEKLPVVCFTLSRNRCDNNAFLLSSVDLTTAREKGEIHSFVDVCIKRLKEADRCLPQVMHMRELLKHGLGVHHSGILPILKEVVEMLFQKGLVKLLFATETFAMGVNMPARTVVFDSIRKHDGKAFRDLLPSEYIQMAGRAGRRGLDTTGTVIILCKGDVPEMSDLYKMMLGKPTKLESQFRVTYTMILNLLRVEKLRVEDMIKKSFGEIFSQKKQASHQVKLKSLSERMGCLPKLDCVTCNTDIEQYYECLQQYEMLKHDLMSVITSHPQGLKVLSVGRVVVVHTEYHPNVLAVILATSSDPKSRTFTVLALSERSAQEENEIPSLESAIKRPSSVAPSKLNSNKVEERDDLENSVKPYSSHLFKPEGPSGQCLLDIRSTDLQYITTKTIKLDPNKIIMDCKKRQQPRFRNDPPGPSTLSATQEIAKIHVSNIGELPRLNLLKDLSLRDIELVDQFKKLEKLEGNLDQFLCLNCPNFFEHFRHTKEIMKIKSDIANLKYLLSEESLQCLPEYRSKIQVLQALEYIDERKTVKMKGNVACEMSNHELLTTELILEDILTPLEPSEIAALLSCMVFQQKTDNVPKLTKTLEEGVKRIKEIAERIGHTQIECGLLEPVMDFVDQYKFGLTEVVYEWAQGTPFAKITDLTDVQEGIIVRCIQRLDETLKDVKNAARIIGNPVLHQKMVEASDLIKRDIIFAASLYTQNV